MHGWWRMGQGVCKKSLYLPLNFIMNLKLLFKAFQEPPGRQEKGPAGSVWPFWPVPRPHLKGRPDRSVSPGALPSSALCFFSCLSGREEMVLEIDKAKLCLLPPSSTLLLPFPAPAPPPLLCFGLHSKSLVTCSRD